MQKDQFFIKFAAVAAMVTFLTTIGVHFISFSPSTFEDRLLLSQNHLYIAHKWMIILHCLCVIISMLGVGLLYYKENRGWTSLGFLFYSVFGITEISRMFGVLFYLNGLRTQYLETTDEATRMFLQQNIDQFGLVGLTLFTIFAFAFGLGNLCYGIVLSGEKDFSRWIGFGFLYWALTGFLGLANESLHRGWIEMVMEVNGKAFQPLFRLLIGIWLYRLATKME